MATTGYPGDWQRGDAWDFIAIAVGPKVNNWQSLLGMIPQAKELVESKQGENDWYHDGKKCSVFDAVGRRVVYWEMTPEQQDEGLLTWNEHNELALICGGNLMTKKDAQYIANKFGESMFIPGALVAIRNMQLKGSKKDWMIMSTPGELGRTWIEAEGSYPTDWERGDANQFICFTVSAQTRSLSDVLNAIPEARANLGERPPPDCWMYDGVQVSMKNSYGQDIVFGRIPEPLTWAEQNALAKRTGGTLMNNQMAQHLIQENGILDDELFWFACHRRPDGHPETRDWVNTNDDPDWGFATSYIRRKDYPGHWERGDAQPYICFIVGNKVHDWEGILNLIPEVVDHGAGELFEWEYRGEDASTFCPDGPGSTTGCVAVHFRTPRPFKWREQWLIIHEMAD